MEHSEPPLDPLLRYIQLICVFVSQASQIYDGNIVNEKTLWELLIGFPKLY